MMVTLVPSSTQQADTNVSAVGGLAWYLALLFLLHLTEKVTDAARQQLLPKRSCCTFVAPRFVVKRRSARMGWHGELYISRHSPDWYISHVLESPPVCIHFVQAGSRVGYRWENSVRLHLNPCPFNLNPCPCEVNWLAEPAKESSNYEQYIKESHKIEQEVVIYRGFHQPPTEEEYHQLWDEWYGL
jgi:hypothetical protein